MKSFLAKTALFAITAWPLVGAGAPPVRIVQGSGAVEVQDAIGKTLLRLRGATLTHDENENTCGIKGLDLGDTGLGILRNAGQSPYREAARALASGALG